MVDGLKFGLASALLLLSACTPPPYPQDIARQQLEEKDRALVAPYLGRPFWTPKQAKYYVCPKRFSMEGCVLAEGEFTFDSFEGMGRTENEVYLHISFARGPSGFITAVPDHLKFELDHPPVREVGTYPSFIDNPKTKNEAQLAADRRKLLGVVLRMSEAQALASAWGKPDRTVDRRTTTRGHREWWYYPDNNVLVFEDGALVEIQRPGR